MNLQIGTTGRLSQAPHSSWRRLLVSVPLSLDPADVRQHNQRQQQPDRLVGLPYVLVVVVMTESSGESSSERGVLFLVRFFVPGQPFGYEISYPGYDYSYPIACLGTIFRTLIFGEYDFSYHC